MTDFEDQLSWLMQHIHEVETQDIVNFFSEHRDELRLLHPAKKKNEPNNSYFESKLLDAEIDASPFGQKLQAWVDSLPEEIHPLDPDIVEAFEEMITQRVPPAVKPPPPPNLDDLAVRIQMKKAEAQASDPINPQRQWVAAKATQQSLDLGDLKPLDW